MDAATIPEGIVAVGRQVAEGLWAWAREHRRAELKEHERGVLELFRRLMGPALGATVAEATGLAHPAAARLRAPCPACGLRRAPRRPRKRELLTICGALRLDRPYYYCKPCKRGWAPADATLGIAPYEATSAGCREWLALAGAIAPFRDAAALLEELAGLGVGSETVRTHAEAAGGLLDLCRRAAAARVEAEREPAGAIDRAAGLLVVMADGLHLRYLDTWHEVKVGLVAGCEPGRPAAGADPGRPHELLGPSYLASRSPADEFGLLLLAEAARRGGLEVVGWEHAPGDDPADPRVPPLAVLREVVVLGDGAPWIWNLADEHFGRRTEIVDWYHAAEHLWDLAKALHGDGTPEATAWAEAATDLLWDEGAGPLLRLLGTTEAATPAAAEALRLQRGYFGANAGRMDYPAYRARGLPVGSGAVESAARHLVQDRMKRAGMRWSRPGGEALLALCSHVTTHHPRLRAA